MVSVSRLQHRIDTMLAVIEQQQEQVAIEDISEHIQAWCHEGITRKMAIWLDSSLSSEEKSLLCKQVDQDIELSKTAAERKAEQRYQAQYPCTGARDQLLQKLEKSSEDTAA